MGQRLHNNLCLHCGPVGSSVLGKTHLSSPKGHGGAFLRLFIYFIYFLWLWLGFWFIDWFGFENFFFDHSFYVRMSFCFALKNITFILPTIRAPVLYCNQGPPLEASRARVATCWWKMHCSRFTWALMKNSMKGKEKSYYNSHKCNP